MVDIGPQTLSRPLSWLVTTAQNGLEVLRFGGLETGAVASPFEIVERHPMYRLRRYFPDTPMGSRPPVLLVHPMMISADIYDINQDAGAVGMLHAAGVDPWVIDFGSPANEAGGWERTLTDHVVALSGAIDQVVEHTGRSVHLGGYSQGGMFCYQAAAFRKAENLASVITFGSPVDLLKNMPVPLPPDLVTRGAEFLADHVFTRLAITDWMARTGFQLLDPVKTLKSRFDFVRHLHDRDALLPREQQRRFLAREGFVPWSGPAIAELLKQMVAHNRMVVGGFVVNDQTVSIADVTCPILAFVGEVDEIGQPVSVRGIKRAAPRAEVYEVLLHAGHFGLVVGTAATRSTWPTVAEWVQWLSADGPCPGAIHEMPDAGEVEPGNPLTQLAQRAGVIAEVGAGLGRGVVEAATSRLRGTVGITGEASRVLPRLARLGQLKPDTQISLGSLLAEQGKRAPIGECFLFEDRVHTNAAVNTRIDNVVRGLIAVGVRPGSSIGVLMETRPSGLVTIAALSRLGAVSVLLAPGGDVATAIARTEIDTVVTDPDNLQAAEATGLRVLVLGGGDARSLAVSSERVVDLEQIDPHAVRLPAWYRPNPGRAHEVAFVLFTGAGERMEVKYVTNYRWALSAFGTATSAGLGRRDTVYCLAPLHHSSGLLVSLGGAIAGGSRIALARRLEPAKFGEEVQRYGVTVVTYTWAMMREILAADSLSLGRGHPVRLFIGSGMPVGLWHRTTDQMDPARVLEFYASTEGDVVLANVAGIKVGCKGRPVPGTAAVELAAYDPLSGRLIEDESGFVRRCRDDEVGLLISRVNPRIESAKTVMRGVFEFGDEWAPTENLFRRDADGDYWLVDNKRTVIHTARGPVYTQPIVDALGELSEVDLAVAYPVAGDEGRQIAVAAVSLRRDEQITAALISSALRSVPVERRPEIVHVVADIELTSSFRPRTAALSARGKPAPGPAVWVLDGVRGTYRESAEQR